MLFRCSFWVPFADGLQRLIEGLLHRGVFQVELKSNLGDELNEIGQRVWPSHGSVRNRREVLDKISRDPMTSSGNTLPYQKGRLRIALKTSAQVTNNAQEALRQLGGMDNCPVEDLS